MSKVIEKVIKQKLVQYLESNNLINTTQHGFRIGRSTLTNLLEHYDYILKEISEGKDVDSVYLDFAKAFDKVDHGILLHKSKSHGISGNLGKWQ